MIIFYSFSSNDIIIFRTIFFMRVTIYISLKDMRLFPHIFITHPLVLLRTFTYCLPSVFVNFNIHLVQTFSRTLVFTLSIWKASATWIFVNTFSFLGLIIIFKCPSVLASTTIIRLFWFFPFSRRNLCGFFTITFSTLSWN